MFRQFRRITKLYSCTEELARTWPEVLEERKLEVDRTPSWARAADEFLGFPWGEVRDRRWRVALGAERWDDARHGAHRAGTYLRLCYRKRHEPLADEVVSTLMVRGIKLVMTNEGPRSSRKLLFVDEDQASSGDPLH